MLSRFPNSTLKVGAKVSLSPDSEFNRGYSSNPVGVVGQVTNLLAVNGYEKWLSVEWSNGGSNNYRHNDYDLIAEGEPGFLATE